MTAVLFAAAAAVVGQTEASGRVFAGETLAYEGKLNRLRLNLTVAGLTFAASAGSEAGQLLVKTEADSKGTLLKLFRYSFLQQYESIIDLDGFKILKTTKHDVQKERVRDSEAVFSYAAKRVNYTESDPKDRNRAPRRIASEIPAQVYDLVSAVYAVRLEPLSVGKRFEFSISDSGLVYKVPVVVTGREELKTVIGKVTCFVVEPEIFGPGRLIEQKGKMRIWMANDARHTPVKAHLDTGYGKIEIKLRSVINPS